MKYRFSAILSAHRGVSIPTPHLSDANVSDAEGSL